MLAAKSIQGLRILDTAQAAANVMQWCVEAAYRAPIVDALVAAPWFRSGHTIDADSHQSSNAMEPPRD